MIRTISDAHELYNCNRAIRRYVDQWYEPSSDLLSGWLLVRLVNRAIKELNWERGRRSLSHITTIGLLRGVNRCKDFSRYVCRQDYSLEISRPLKNGSKVLKFVPVNYLDPCDQIDHL